MACLSGPLLILHTRHIALVEIALRDGIVSGGDGFTRRPVFAWSRRTFADALFHDRRLHSNAPFSVLGRRAARTLTSSLWRDTPVFE